MQTHQEALLVIKQSPTPFASSRQDCFTTFKISNVQGLDILPKVMLTTLLHGIWWTLKENIHFEVFMVGVS